MYQIGTEVEDAQVLVDSSSNPTESVPIPVPTKWEPKRLTSKHKQILSLYAQGERRDTVALMCKCVPEYVTMLAGTNQGRSYIQSIQAAVDDQLSNLTYRSVAVLEAGMDQDQPMDTRLKAAALQLKAAGRMKGGEDTGAATAEDVIGRILNLQLNVSVQR